MDFKDVEFVQNIVDREDSKDFMDKLIYLYCSRSSENCQHLVDTIPNIVNQQIRFYSNQTTDYRQAANWLIVGRSMDKTDKHSYFASMVPIMKTMYPEGLSGSESYARIKYFEEFIELMKDPEVFSLDNKSDIQWATQFDYLDYLVFIYRNYVQEVRPCQWKFVQYAEVKD